MAIKTVKTTHDVSETSCFRPQEVKTYKVAPTQL